MQTVTSASGATLFHFELPEVRGEHWTLRLDAHRRDAPGQGRGRIACLCPTWEKKRGWMALLLAQWAAQTYRDRLLIIADGSPQAVDLTGYDERIVYLHRPGTSLAARRNLLLQEARRLGAPWFCWFDDDELRDPRWLELVLGQWDGRAQVVTPPGHWFLDVRTGRSKKYYAPNVSLSGAIFETERCARYQFPDMFPEDTPWLQAISMSRRVQRLDEMYVWNVTHDDNIGCPRTRIFGGVMTKDYEVGTWGDRPLYACKLCAYSVLDREKFVSHMAHRHAVTVTLDENNQPARSVRTKRQSKAADDTGQTVREAVNAALAEEPEADINSEVNN